VSSLMKLPHDVLMGRGYNAGATFGLQLLSPYNLIHIKSQRKMSLVQ